MAQIEKRTFSLPAEHAQFIDGLVKSLHRCRAVLKLGMTTAQALAARRSWTTARSTARAATDGTKASPS